MVAVWGKSCETCRWFSAWASGEKGHCQFPLPVWLLDKIDHQYTTNVVDADNERCNAHEERS